MSRAQQGKDLLAWMREQGLDEFGSVIPQHQVREVLGLEFPSSAAKRVFDQLALMELSAVDYARNVLLDEGKYLAQTRDHYRILLPSENSAQIASYMGSADAKLKRGLRLLRNTPTTDAPPPLDNVEARIVMKREAIRNQRRR